MKILENCRFTCCKEIEPVCPLPVSINDIISWNCTITSQADSDTDVVKMQNNSITTTITSTFLPPSSLPYPLAVTSLFFLSIILSSHKYYQWNHTVTFWNWLFFSLCLVLWKFFQIVVCSSTSFLVIAESYSVVRMYYNLYNHLPLKDDNWVVSSFEDYK